MASFWIDNSKLTGTLKVILRSLCVEVDWKDRASKLLKRIRRIGRNQDFSVRDWKLLRKLVNQQKRAGNVNFSKLEYFFPGKSEELLQRTYTERSMF
jgi:hypothetical protein